MPNKKLRSLAGLVVLVITIGLFVWYFRTHPELLTQLKQVRLTTILVLLALYSCFTGALVLVLYYSLRICRTRMPAHENVMLTIYSSIVNFFGPLQSGPGFRAVYLKKKHAVNFKDFIKASLIYYACFAIISGLFLFGPSLVWWQAMLALIGVLAVCAAVIRVRHISFKSVSGQPVFVVKLALVTLLQLSIVAVIYFIELRSVSSAVSFRQAIIYTGAANFAVFVSLTPGAIGFRETFLLLAHRLHHIPNSTVIAASVIDRAVYISFLGILFLLVLALHAKSRLHVSE
jgi:uncharacterized membrane protein YbhN (UPF0104 family)